MLICQKAKGHDIFRSDCKRKKMHILQPKHTILKKEAVEKLLEEFNISLIQLPKIKITDPALPEGTNIGDVIQIDRKDEDGNSATYYRVVVI